MSSSNFADLGVTAPFLGVLSRMGFTEATPVQVQAIPLLIAGRDLISSAPTGTGKTAAFMVPALQRIAGAEGRRGRGPRILVLTPTRELAQQVSKASQAFSRAMPRTTTVCVTGGESYVHQNRLLAAPHEVLVATPGRLIDQMNNGRIDFSRVEFLVLDEADRMLDMGFADDVLGIAQALPAERQTVCFSATLSRGVRDLADRLLRDPQWLEVERVESDETSIDQHVLYVDSFDHRHRLLEAFLADEGLGQAIIFTSTKAHAEQLAGQLGEAGHSADSLHGDLNQRQRTRALNRLRRGDCKVLVATDVAARGIDVPSITHVINFNLPKFAEDYVHRIGRTGRAGATGQALSLVGREDVFTLRKIEHFIGHKVQVSEIAGLEARFKPVERKPSGGGGAFRKPGYGNRPSGGYAKTGSGFGKSPRGYANSGAGSANAESAVAQSNSGAGNATTDGYRKSAGYARTAGAGKTAGHGKSVGYGKSAGYGKTSAHAKTGAHGNAPFKGPSWGRGREDGARAEGGRQADSARPHSDRRHPQQGAQGGYGAPRARRAA